MHPLLVNFNIISSWEPLIGSEEAAIKFLTDVGLIPPKNALMFCPLCGCEAPGSFDKAKKVGFRYICKNRRRTKCKGCIYPLKNTFFEGSKIPFRDILAIIICFVIKLPVAFVSSEICEYRKFKGQDLPIHCHTVAEYYRSCEDIEAYLKSQKSVEDNTDLVQGSGRKSKGEKIYDFLMAMKKIHPGPGMVGLEIKSLVNDKSIDCEEMQLNNLE